MKERATAVWEGGDADPDDIYGRPLWRVEASAVCDDLNVLQYACEITEGGASRLWEHSDSLIDLADTCLFHAPSLKKGILEAFNQLCNDAFADSLGDT